MTYSEIAKKLRLPLGFLFGILYLFLARPTPLTLGVGGAIAFIGVLIRGWASGHIEKNAQLAVSGPYAYTRNPLYFGSFLIAAGFAIAAHWSLLLLVIAFFVFIYAPTMEREKANIASRFPEPYSKYCENVPVFVPRLNPWRGNENSAKRFSFGLYMKHGEWKAALTFFLVMAWFLFMDRFVILFKY